MTAAAIDRSINAKHTFSCALFTRGGLCDCWPEKAGLTGSGSSDRRYSYPGTNSLERCAICGRTLGGLTHAIVDLDGTDQLCERCFLQAEREQLADAM